MEINNEIKKLILEYSEKHQKVKLNKERLLELRDRIMRRLKMKRLPLSTLRKWVKKTIRENKQTEALRKIEMALPAASAVAIPELQIQPIDTTRVYRQTLLFDLSALEKVSEKIVEEISEIEKMAKEKSEKKEILPKIALARRNFEKVMDKLKDLKKRIELLK